LKGDITGKQSKKWNLKPRRVFTKTEYETNPLLTDTGSWEADGEGRWYLISVWMVLNHGVFRHVDKEVIQLEKAALTGGRKTEGLRRSFIGGRNLGGRLVTGPTNLVFFLLPLQSIKRTRD